MASPQILNSLKILAGGPSRQQVLPTEAYGFAGDTPTQGELSTPFEQEQSARAARADARDRAATQQVQDTNASVYEHNRPDVAAIEQEHTQDALQRLLLPIQMRGQYEVEAAKQHAQAQTAQNEMLMGGRAHVAASNQEATTARTAANNQAVTLRQRLQALQTGKAHATPPSGISGWMPGAQGKADQAEIASLLSQVAGETTSPDEAPAEAGARMSRRLKNGGVAYSDDGGATWYQE